jgi:hypothetical protein
VFVPIECRFVRQNYGRGEYVGPRRDAASALRQFEKRSAGVRNGGGAVSTMN